MNCIDARNGIDAIFILYEFNCLIVGVVLRPPPVAEKGSKALSEITSKRKHIYVQRIAIIFQTGAHWAPALMIEFV
ncbi:hypothetical protein DXD83_07160 [Ruminococcus bromii]|jgi:hypothetical protein|nr:hypothetical protein DXD86_08855 [Ruminococcus bromii]RGI81340.1 hypothetical protein DXD83_07160 [Ruminococcus bromii]